MIENLPKNIKAKVLRAKMTVYGEPVELGAVVDVDKITFRNLEKKGFLERVGAAPAAESGEGGSTPKKGKKAAAE